MANFEVLTFFLHPTRSTKCWHFNCVDMVCWSAPPSYVSASSTACSYECVAWPSLAFVAASCAANVAAIAFSYPTAFCATSHVACTSAAAVSFRLFSANFVMHSLASSFFFCAAALLSSARSRARHSRGHASKTVKMASSVATKGNFVHYFVKSFHALIYMLCMSALISAKLDILL